MNEVFTSTNFSRINLDKHQLLKQMVFISTGWDHLSANPNEEHASSQHPQSERENGSSMEEHQDF